MSDYLHTRNGIISAGFNPEVLEKIATHLSKVKHLNEASDIYSQFELEADKLPWPQDHDFGALALQAASINAVNDIKKFMLSKALSRAQWCATCSTSGGEGLARMQHVKELEKILTDRFSESENDV